MYSTHPCNRVISPMGSQQHHLCFYISKVSSFSVSFFSPQAVPLGCGGGMTHTDFDRFRSTSRTFSAFPTVGREKHQLVWEMFSFAGQQEWRNTESYRGGHLHVRDELFHCKDHFSMIKQKTKRWGFQWKKKGGGGEDNLNPILYFEICYLSGSISSFFCQPPPSTPQNKNSYQWLL